MTNLGEDLKGLREAGGFSSRDELLEEVFRTLLKENPEFRVEFAVEKYRSGSVSLN